MDVPAYKIASFELVDLQLIDRVARTGKPLIISTGLGSLRDIEDAVMTARATGLTQIALLKCSSAYPAPPDEINLNTIPDLARRFGVPIGLSDHTLGIGVPIAAIAVGATIIEKHMTLARTDPGPDNAFSLEPGEFKAMVDGIRVAEKALGSVSYGATPSEEPGRVFRRSLFVVADVAAGESLTDHNVRSIRPGAGLAPKELPTVLGRKAVRAIRRGTPLSWDLVEPDTR
jgi:N-acetylneuraminate synthase